MSAYDALAGYYDSLMPAQAYPAWAEACDALFRPRALHSVLDLACGTGRLAWLLADRGYEVLGADISCDMLAEAAARADEHPGAVRPLFIQQAAQELDLFGTVQAAVCSMDGMNYLAPEDFADAAQRVRLFMEPGGCFLFDLHAPEKFRRMDGQTFSSDSEDAFCVWTANLSEDGAACDYAVELFTRAGKLWRRASEEHREYVHEPAWVCDTLCAAGFGEVRICGGLPLREPEAGDERLFFIAEAD